MKAFILYYSKDPDKPLLPESFQQIPIDLPDCHVFGTEAVSNLFRTANERYEFYLFGNYTFYKSFNVTIDLLIKEDQIQNDELQKVFRQINGIYSCVLIDRLNHLVHVMTDFLGFYPLYVYQDNHQTLFASEIKFFYYFNKIDLKLNYDAMVSYLDNGHLVSDQSWFQKIQRMRPASIYTLNLDTGKLQNSYYWTWSQIRKKELPKKEIINTYSSLFKDGIKDLDITSKSVTGISLSGGLDSRWIAQIAKSYYYLEAFTFASKKNYETSIAAQVANAIDIKDKIAYIHKKNWLLNRLDALWKTDGMLHLGHLHEGNIYKERHSSYAHCFHGFYGGGIYANLKECNQRINQDIASSHFDFKKINPNTEDVFYDTTCIDPYITDQKIRNQSAYSIYLLSSYTKMVIPFYNMNWMEYNYSINDRLQLNSKLYLEVLNSDLIDPLLNIPWQRTGLLPKYVHLNVQSLKIKIPRILETITQRFHLSRHFINYNFFDNEIDRWIRKFKSDITNLQIFYPLHSRERKLRMLSLVVWLKMISKNNPDVI